MPPKQSACNLDKLRVLIDARRVELGLPMLAVDFAAGLPDGYYAKLMCGMKNFGPRSLSPILAALGVEIVLMPYEPKPSAPQAGAAGKTPFQAEDPQARQPAPPPPRGPEPEAGPRSLRPTVG
jgi:hypothetical protein